MYSSLPILMLALAQADAWHPVGERKLSQAMVSARGRGWRARDCKMAVNEEQPQTRSMSLSATTLSRRNFASVLAALAPATAAYALPVGEGGLPDGAKQFASVVSGSAYRLQGRPCQ